MALAGRRENVGAQRRTTSNVQCPRRQSRAHLSRRRLHCPLPLGSLPATDAAWHAHVHARIMSALSVLSPLLRRGAATRWTCRTCLGLGPQAQRSFASRVDAADFTIRPGEKNKNKSRSNGNGSGSGNGNNSGRSSKRRSRLLVAGGVVAVGAVAVATNDDAKHAWTAAQRSYRVLSTLVLNIRE
jgi:hypothetical protein